jgi:hypothetical protein
MVRSFKVTYSLELCYVKPLITAINPKERRKCCILIVDMIGTYSGLRYQEIVLYTLDARALLGQVTLALTCSVTQCTTFLHSNPVPVTHSPKSA